MKGQGAGAPLATRSRHAVSRSPRRPPRARARPPAKLCGRGWKRWPRRLKCSVHSPVANRNQLGCAGAVGNTVRDVRAVACTVQLRIGINWVVRAQSSCESELTGLCVRSPVANGNQLGCARTVQLRIGINWVVRAQFSCESESTGLCVRSTVDLLYQLGCAGTVGTLRLAFELRHAALGRRGQRSGSAPLGANAVDSPRARPAREESSRPLGLGLGVTGGTGRRALSPGLPGSRRPGRRGCLRAGRSWWRR